MTTKIFNEIKTDYVDDDNLRHIDGYLTDDGNENGFTIAVFDLDTGKTIFLKNEYRSNDQVNREIEKLKLKHTKTTGDRSRPIIEGIEPYLVGLPNEPEDSRVRLICDACGSEHIYAERTASWDIDTQRWEINDPYDYTVICNDCGLANADPNELSLNQTHIEINDDQWQQAFKPITNHLNPHANWYGCLFDYKGKEYDVIKELVTSKPNHIWTVTDDDCSYPIIVSGWHHVNRHGYFITKNPFRCDVSVIGDDAELSDDDPDEDIPSI